MVKTGINERSESKQKVDKTTKYREYEKKN